MKDLWQRANEIVPGGNHLFSKTPDRYCPGQWPPYYKTAREIDVTTTDGRHYKDFSVMGAGNSVLGYSDPDVTSAVYQAYIDGNVSTLNCPEEVDLAELMLKINPKMDMVRFGRSGNDACQIALRIAHEYSNSHLFAMCGYHGWQIGHPPELDPNAFPFEYGDIEAAEDAITPDIGAVIMECVRSKPVDKKFLQFVRHLTIDLDIPLIFDEVASGFRCNLGGYHQLIDVYPDMVCYGKAMGNGTAISAVVGQREFMECALNTFISSMFWSERAGYAAGLATIEKMKRVDAQRHIMQTGRQAKEIWTAAGEDAGIPLETSGLDPLATFNFTGDDTREKITTFTQEMLKRGYLAGNQFYPSTAHRQKDMDEYEVAVFQVFNDIAAGKVRLEGAPAVPGFRRLA